MPMYDARGIYNDPILTDFSLGYGPQAYIADQVMPFTDVALPSGRYRVFDRSNWVTFPSRREPGTVANEIRGGKWSEDTFSVKEHALQVAIDDEERQNYNAANQNAQANLFAGIDPEADAVELMTRSLLIEYENAVATLVRNASNYGSQTVTKSGTGQWDDASSTPVADVVTALQTVFDSVLLEPNLAIIPKTVWLSLFNHPQIIARYQYVQAQVDQEAAFRALTGFNGTILFPNNRYNTADNIDASESLTTIWGKDVFFGYVNNTAGQKIQTFGKTFYQPVNGQLRSVTRWREEQRTSDVIRTQWRWDLKLVQPLCGYLIKNAVS
jgi:hypothetical protein